MVPNPEKRQTGGKKCISVDTSTVNIGPIAVQNASIQYRDLPFMCAR